MNADDGAWAGRCGDELIAWCVAAVRRGVTQELAAMDEGELPAVRLLRRIQVHPVDSAELRNEAVGRMAITETERRLTQPR